MMLAVMLALHDAGYQVSTPFGENTRYDLVLDDGTTLTRLQCKTGQDAARRGGVRDRELLRDIIRTRSLRNATIGVRSMPSRSIAARRAGST